MGDLAVPPSTSSHKAVWLLGLVELAELLTKLAPSLLRGHTAEVPIGHQLFEEVRVAPIEVKPAVVTLEQSACECRWPLDKEAVGSVLYPILIFGYLLLLFTGYCLARVYRGEVSSDTTPVIVPKVPKTVKDRPSLEDLASRSDELAAARSAARSLRE